VKIVNKKEFYALPNGTLYSYYEPCVIMGLHVKKENIYYSEQPCDFYYESLIGNIDTNGSDDYDDLLEDAENNKTSLKMDFNCVERDAFYNDDQLYAIYEKSDIEAFIEKLQSLI
jgi:hypothetical protein